MKIVFENHRHYRKRSKALRFISGDVMRVDEKEGTVYLGDGAMGVLSKKGVESLKGIVS